MGHSQKAERIETADGIGYLYGGKMYSEREYMDLGGTAGGGEEQQKKKSPVGSQNVKPKGGPQDVLQQLGYQMLRGPVNNPPAGTEVQTSQQGFGYAFKDTDPEFWKITQKPLTEGEYNTWLNLTQNDQSLFPTMKRSRLEWLAANAPKALPQQQQPVQPGMTTTPAGGNQGVEYIDPLTGKSIIQLPTQVAGGTQYQPPVPGQQQPVQPQQPPVKTQRYMGKEAPVVEAGSFTDAMRQFASTTQDPTGKVFWWNGKAYKYSIAQPGAEGQQKVPGATVPGTQGKYADKETPGEITPKQQYKFPEEQARLSQQRSEGMASQPKTKSLLSMGKGKKILGGGKKEKFFKMFGGTGENKFFKTSGGFDQNSFYANR